MKAVRLSVLYAHRSFHLVQVHPLPNTRARTHRIAIPECDVSDGEDLETLTNCSDRPCPRLPSRWTFSSHPRLQRGSSEAHWTESLTGYPRRHAESSVNLAALLAKQTDLHPAELLILMMRVGGQAEGGEGVQPLGRASGRVLSNKALPRSRKDV